jgi:hypothetical protein
MNNFNKPFTNQAEEVVVEEEEEAEVEVHQCQQQHLNNLSLLQQMLKPWEDFPKSSMEITPELTTLLKK